MRIKVTDVTQKISFVAVDSTDGFTRETGISAWTVYYSLNGGTATVMITPTVGELSATNMAGVYVLTVDESGMVSAKGELTLHITATGVAPITRVIEITDNFESDSYAIVNHGTYGNSAIETLVDDLETRLTATRATLLDNLDVAVSTRSSHSAADVWASATRTLTSLGTLVADIWGYTTRVLTAGTNIALAKGTGVTGFNDITAADVWAVGTRTLTSFGTLIADVWAYSSRTLTAFSTSLALSIWDVLESAILTASSIGLKVKTNLDATISSRLASSGYTAPDNAGITSILTESQSHPTLAEIEATTILAKESTVSAVKTKTDTIVWGDITNIKDESLGKWSINKTTNVMTFYKADGVTILKQFNLTDNASVSERVPV